MSSRDPISPNDERHVVSFRRRMSLQPPTKTPTPIENLAKYEQNREENDNYQHRMVVNILAFFIVAILIGAGLWLANTMADMRKNQDCVLSGRRSCLPVEVNESRW